MNVLSLFDGLSCGQIALNKIGLKPSKYYASEIDKYAIKVCMANYPNTIQLGDVTKWREWAIDWSSIDLLIGGSPCQGFSFAGKQLAFDDPRSKLFFVYVDILNHIRSVNPKIKFMLENVRMKKEYLAIISEQLGVEPVFINSALVSAQNRQRFYWCNWHVEQPEDKGILLKDIIEHEPENITVMSDKFVKRQEGKKCLIDDTKPKAASLSAMEYVKNGRQGDYLKIRPCEPKDFDQDSLCHHAADATDIKGHGYNKGVYAGTGKAPSLAAASGGNLEPKVLCGSMVGRKINPITGKRDDYNPKLKATQRIEVRGDEKTNFLTTVQKDNLVIRHKSKCVRSSGRGSYDRHEWDSISDCHYRKLTPIECERLQTVSDNYTNHVSNTQRYKMLGNGWTVDVIAHIFNQMELPVQVFARQLELFGDAA